MPEAAERRLPIVHTCILTYLLTYLLTYIHTYILTYLHTYILTYITVMELITEAKPKDGLFGPKSITVVSMDPLGGGGGAKP